MGQNETLESIISERQKEDTVELLLEREFWCEISLLTASDQMTILYHFHIIWLLF